MYVMFFACAACIFVATILHLASVKHVELQKKYGYAKGTKIGRTFGVISGTMESAFLIGLWIAPQPKFTLTLFSGWTFTIGDVSIPLFNLTFFLVLVVPAAYIALTAVNATGLKVAETHCKPEKLMVTGPYAIVRHPQYFGWIIAHVGTSVLLSASYSTFFTPFLLGLIILISKKEEEGLIEEFGDEYKNYKKKVPMLIPKIYGLHPRSQM